MLFLYEREMKLFAMSFLLDVLLNLMCREKSYIFVGNFILKDCWEWYNVRLMEISGKLS